MKQNHCIFSLRIHQTPKIDAALFAILQQQLLQHLRSLDEIGLPTFNQPLKMAIQDSPLPLQDALLFCHEAQWEEGVKQDDDDETEVQKETSSTLLMSPVHVTDEDLHWSDDELTMLFKNETEHPKLMKQRDLEIQSAVGWMMRVVSRYGFTPPTAILAVDYFDRFMSTQHHHRHCNAEKAWTLQLTAVACLSLAAKVEETKDPLPLDLQVEEAKFMFGPLTIQRMELLVLSTLQWRMHPVTPFSFIDHIIRRLALKPNQLIECLDHSSRILTSLVIDSRWGLYPSSALACATMIHVMEQVVEDQGCSNSIDDYQNQLFGALITINKEKVGECYKLIHELMIHHHKRKFMDSPNAVVEHASSHLLTGDSSNDSSSFNSTTTTTTTTAFLQLEPSSSSSELPALKRTRYIDDEADDVKYHDLILG